MNGVLNRHRAETLLAQAGVDVLVGTTHANVFYLTGYIGFSQRLMPTTQVYALAHTGRLDEPVLVAPAGDLDMQAQFPTRLSGLHAYGHFFVEPGEESDELESEQERFRRVATLGADGTASKALLDELATLPGTARIALDERGIAPDIRDAVLARFGDRVVAGAPLLDAIRMVKTEEEVRRLEAAAHAIEQSYLRALQVANEGISEADLARAFDCRTIELGSQPHFTVIAFGERSALPNAVPSRHRQLRAGDQIRFDIGCRTEMYSSDIARTAVLGEPGKKLRAYYQAILAGEDRLLELLKPGLTAREAFSAAVGATREAGIPHYRRHHVGHGVGLDTYDPPLLGPDSEIVLEPGMVFEIETPYYELGFGGIQVEDTVAVTETGYRLLTRSSRELAVIA